MKAYQNSYRMVRPDGTPEQVVRKGGLYRTPLKALGAAHRAIQSCGGSILLVGLHEEVDAEDWELT